MITVKSSAVELEERKPYCLSLRSLFIVEVSSNFLVDDNFKMFANDTKEADLRSCIQGIH